MKASADAEWERYGRALISSMSEVLDETPEQIHSNLLETADYWLSLGLVLGLRDRPGARRENPDRPTLASVDPRRIARRAKNKIVGRALDRAGLWRLLFR
jgi:hypothetical protein